MELKLKETVDFMGHTLTAYVCEYQSDAIPAIQLVCEDGEPWDVATINLAPRTPNPGCVFIKDNDYSTGTFEALMKAGIVTESLGRLSYGWVVDGAVHAKLSASVIAQMEAGNG